MLSLSGQCSDHPSLWDLRNVDDLDIVESQCHDLLGVEYARRPEYRPDYVSMILMDFAHMEELDLDTFFVLIRPLTENDISTTKQQSPIHSWSLTGPLDGRC